MKKPKLRRIVSRYEIVDTQAPPVYGVSCRHPRSVAGMLRPLIEHEIVEVFIALVLDGKSRATDWFEVSRGTATASLVHPREVFAPALRMGAVSILVAHNHPSGDPDPSAEDIAVTERLLEAGRVLGVPVVDHVVIGSEARYRSLRVDCRLSWGA